MTAAELRERSTEELETLVGQLEDDLFKLRLQRTVNQLENTMAIRHKRRDVARAKTLLSARARGLETQVAAKEQ